MQFVQTWYMNKVVIVFVSLIGILFLVLAGLYVIHPANALPTFIPGYDPHLTRHHLTHAVAAAGLGLLCFAFVWFATGKKKSVHEEKEGNS